MTSSRGICFGCLAAALLLGACDRKPAAPAPAAAPEAPAAPLAGTGKAEAAAEPAVETAAAESEELATEAPEQDPASKVVKLKLDVAPRSARPVVWWGKQKLGEAPLTIERPRRSGPMNLVIKADGYLDHHTRLFTDRDDRLSVLLVRPADAVGMLGYKRKPGQLPPAARGDAGVPLPKVAPVPGESAPAASAPEPVGEPAL